MAATRSAACEDRCYIAFFGFFLGRELTEESLSMMSPPSTDDAFSGAASPSSPSSVSVLSTLYFSLARPAGVSFWLAVAPGFAGGGVGTL